MKIKHFTHSENYKNNEFQHLEFTLVTECRSRYYLDNVTEVNLTTENNVYTDRGDFFSQLKELVATGAEVILGNEEDGTFARTFTVMTQHHGTFTLKGYPVKR